ncbi:MAG: hypothetical protein A2271_00690 [Candidatus Moranbacteria bacterium RIFOXYA12_FULL_35_19]|nr:MAG: hypothetical protein UR78_C0027G0014 [Candidatus Moranbacteria bacterium GW2011_GWF2_35_39]OGI35881.1 MAG: hypothetical protein A2271_00690 [Candidatus Moranbacteria bacterium RIFOXYA12_FULL_35_19]
MSQQIFWIHGGNVFNSHKDYLEFLKTREATKEYFIGKNRWVHHLQADLGDGYEVFLPQMPCATWNAKYSEWKIWFEKSFPFLKDNLILAGGSLGGMFLAKYLSENDFPLKIKGAFLLAAPFDDKDKNINYTLGDFALPKSLEKFSTQCSKIFLYHSKDDPLVPFIDLEKYSKALPNAEKIIFEDKGHFKLKEFPEFVEKLKSIK